MSSAKPSTDDPPWLSGSVVREDTIEYGFIGTLQKLKYEYRPDIRDRAALEANFREKSNAATKQPTGKIRQIQYKLHPGEAGWLLKPHQTVDF